ncbi:MAG TPA: FAD-dependent oxidoreductase, partial [Arthrobacter bacterium]|nr:FAD-dependent oxidoreductase [Arthrobacter sp.]
MNVLIVGAGPAGSTAAYYLAKAGISVTVLEKTSFPREKVCGDGLTPRAVKSLVEMGI